MNSLHFVRSSSKKKNAPTPQRTVSTPTGLLIYAPSRISKPKITAITIGYCPCLEKARPLPKIRRLSSPPCHYQYHSRFPGGKKKGTSAKWILTPYSVCSKERVNRPPISTACNLKTLTNLSKRCKWMKCTVNLSRSRSRGRSNAKI